MFQERFTLLIFLSNILLFKCVQRQLSNCFIQTHTSSNVPQHYAVGTDHGTSPFSVSFTLDGSPHLFCPLLLPAGQYLRISASLSPEVNSISFDSLFHNSHRNSENSAGCEESAVFFVKRQNPQHIINYMYGHCVIVAAPPERN